jgi:hypothetical protein
MIGFCGFVEELSFVLVPLFLLLIVIAGIRRVSKSSGGIFREGHSGFLASLGMTTLET